MEKYNKEIHITKDTEEIDFHKTISEMMQYVNASNAIKNVQRGIEYVVQIPVKYKDALEKGEVFLNQNSKTGVLWPTLYKKLENGKREFVDNLPIKEEQMIHGDPFESLANSYHNICLQQQISDLAEKMEQTYRIVESIEHGQLDDRIGTLLAGRDQILRALSFESDERITARY